MSDCILRLMVLYTSALRRLAGVTQVVSPTEGHIFHNRMTRTLEAAQVGRRLAELLCEQYSLDFLDGLGGLDPDSVEAATLAHDLGHPPFGHLAEKELQTLLDGGHPHLPGSFAGIAQSLRIVTDFAIPCVNVVKLHESYPGLD